MIKINGREIEVKEFPNKETRYSIEDIEAAIATNKFSININFKFEDNKTLMDLFFINAYLEDKHSERLVSLLIRYMPYSRMDRENDDYLFTLKYTVDFIERMSFDYIIVYEPHSSVTEELFTTKIIPVMASNSLLLALKDDINFNIKKDVIVYPDAGAMSRYKSDDGSLFLMGKKHRNFTTGRIESLTISGDKVEKGFRAIIVDDLCSYGGTFMWTASILKEMGAGEIYLVAAHAEESIFLGDIFKTDLITAVYTTDSILNNDRDEPRLHIK